MKPAREPVVVVIWGRLSDADRMVGRSTHTWTSDRLTDNSYPHFMLRVPTQAVSAYLQLRALGRAVPRGGIGFIGLPS